MSSFNINTSERIVYLSRAGVVADGVSDQTVKLQAILDSQKGMPLRVVNDLHGTLVADHLLIWSNTTLETLAGGVWLKKGSDGIIPGSGLQILRNKNVVGGPAAAIDSNIHIRGGLWDGNRRNFGTGATMEHWKYMPKCAKMANDRDEIVPSLGFYGVQHWSVRDVDFYDLTSYGVHGSNACDGWVENITKKLHPGDTDWGDNAVQLQGYSRDILIEGVRGEANDDLVAVNANDGLDIYPKGSPTTFIPGIVSGPCSDITIRNLAVHGAGHLVRLLAGDKSISRILIEDATMDSPKVRYGVYFSSFAIPGNSTWSDITIRNIRGYCPTETGLVGFFDCQNATISRVIIDGLSAQEANGQSVVTVAGGTINELLVNNIVATNCPYLIDVSGGSVANLSLGAWSATGLKAPLNDPGSRVKVFKQSQG